MARKPSVGAVMRIYKKLNASVFLLLVFLMAISGSRGAMAWQIDLEDVTKLRSGKGAVIFSYTVRGWDPEIAGLDWRSLEEDGEHGNVVLKAKGLFSNETLFNTRHGAIGRFVALQLSPGTYEFYNFRTNDRNLTLGPEKEFSRRFTVVPGKVQYIGNIDILVMPPNIGAGSIWAMALIGTAAKATEIIPSLVDRSDVDMPILSATVKGLDTASIVKNVMLDEADSRMLKDMAALQEAAAKGDLEAKSRLFQGMQSGWTYTESGDRQKILADAKQMPKLAEGLANKGIAGAAYYLGLLYTPGEKVPRLDGISVDAARAAAYYLADAERYYPPAMLEAKWIYKRGRYGVAENDGLSKLWDKRLDIISALNAESVPYLDQSGRAEFKRFLDASFPRYFAISASGAFGLSVGDDSSEKDAISACETRRQLKGERCRLYAVNKKVVWEACPSGYGGPNTTSLSPVVLGEAVESEDIPIALLDGGKEAYKAFVKTTLPRAFAVSPKGSFAYSSGDCRSAYNALKVCSEKAGESCKLYALDDQIVYDATEPKFLESQQRLSRQAGKATRTQ